mmetsp:Transcript_45990/g.73977  ORF Transcript_45990/g.73977 Transcript_45990/m.73977 type:complete len:100 (-) Transcript_45990:97-396(-)
MMKRMRKAILRLKRKEERRNGSRTITQMAVWFMVVTCGLAFLSGDTIVGTVERWYVIHILKDGSKSKGTRSPREYATIATRQFLAHLTISASATGLESI